MAIVGRTGSKLNVMDLASMPLPIKQFSAAIDDETPASTDNPFEGPSGTEGEVEENIDYSSIREFIATHYIARASLALSFEVPHVRTLLLPVEKKDSTSKILARAMEEAQKSLNITLSKRSIAFQRAGERNVLAIAHLEPSPLIALCSAPMGAEKRAPHIAFITSNEIAVINMVRVHFPAKDGELVHVIHVDDDVTRFFVIRGRHVEYIAPPIQQGAHDAHLVSTLYNRIELTAENAGYLNPDKVVLSGKAEEIGLKEEILENNPDVIFHSLRRLRIGYSDDKALLQDMNNYLVPISLAWEALQPKVPHFYRLDVTPAKVRDEQKKLKLAWHGVLLLLMLFVAVTAITVNILDRQSEIDSIETSLNFDRQQLQEQEQIVDQITELEARSRAIRVATTTLDTLLVNAELWTETLDTLSKGTASLGDLWVSELKVDRAGGMAVIGYALRRSSVPTLSTLIGDTKLREVTVQDIGKNQVFRYNMQLRLEDLYPYSASPAARWHDSVRIALGNMIEEEPESEADTAETESPQQRTGRR